MKGFILLVAFAALATYHAYAQKVYIGCPEKVNAIPNAGFLAQQPVDVVIFDSRTIPAGAKIECQGTEVRQALQNFLQSEFPSCKMTLLPDTLSAPKPGKITIKIGISAYQASLARSEWTGTVNYRVTVTDNRHQPGRKQSEEISNEISRPNILGYRAAKKCLFMGFDKSNQDLVSFIENTLKD
ncbi:hypothetical protein [Mucilaginibacter sp.]|jgi:hypothetical protein|uniref:hypothetical protein n=1 Tax=Mucilaginibacter sp. TaxID=1882438 RepID=UPI002C27DB7D|nr:hypothetical protein [Mucilaginibacter sp.]HTI61201.1 hypothetical protein [Mucilaginibacter sp.]